MQNYNQNNQKPTLKLSVGLNDKDKHEQLIPTEVAMMEMGRLLIRHGIGGANITPMMGIYTYETGEIEMEQSLEVMPFVDIDQRPLIMELVEDIKREFNQESVAITTVFQEVELV